MIAPLADTALSGVIWYQGETDNGRAPLYTHLLTAMIDVWRRAFRQKLPFGIVQLAAYGPTTLEMGKGRWAGLREAQRQAALTIPDTGLVIAIDAGERDDIHPRNKRPVGERLARWARAAVYGEALTPGSPVFVSSEQTPAGRLVRFQNGMGLRTRDGGPVRGFEAGGDGSGFTAVSAEIRGDAILLPEVTSAEVTVRYAWADFPEANVESGEGLPAGPFLASP
jgi:sialate O-acetylesterase